MWRDTIQFSKEHHVKFTYFISAPYYLTESELQYHPYWALKEDPRPILIKFRSNNQIQYIESRKEYMLEAIKNGNEIASHLCGHYDGSNWTYDQWMKEFSFFRYVIDCIFYNIKGVRAPYLGTNEAYFKALKDSGFVWDSSRGVHPGSVYQIKEEIPIRSIKVICNRKEYSSQLPSVMLPFDCDFITHVHAHYMLASEFPMFDYQQAEDEFFNSLCADYLSDSKLPTQICLHFEHRTGEPYLKAMKHFVEWVQDKNPRFLTYSEYLKEKQ